MINLSAASDQTFRGILGIAFVQTFDTLVFPILTSVIKLANRQLDTVDEFFLLSS